MGLIKNTDDPSRRDDPYWIYPDSFYADEDREFKDLSDSQYPSGMAVDAHIVNGIDLSNSRITRGALFSGIESDGHLNLENLSARDVAILGCEFDTVDICNADIEHFHVDDPANYEFKHNAGTEIHRFRSTSRGPITSPDQSRYYADEIGLTPSYDAHEVFGIRIEDVIPFMQSELEYRGQGTY